MNQRDYEILANLDRFQVMTRDHIATIHFANNARPWVNANRVLKRLSMEGKLLQIPQPRDRCYLYKSLNARVRENSSKLFHYLEIVDTYIELGKPSMFHVEHLLEFYIPDVYTGDMCIEIQRSKVSNQRIQDKINRFVYAYQKGLHDAQTLWIRSPFKWKHLMAPSGLRVVIAPSLPD